MPRLSPPPRSYVLSAVCLPHCVCVFLSVSWQLHVKNYSSNLHEFFFRNLLWTRKNLLNSGGHPHLDQTLGIFWRILQHYGIGYVSTIRLISPENLIGFSRRFLSQIDLWAWTSGVNTEVHALSKEVQSKFRKSSGYGARIWTTDWLVIKAEYNKDRRQCRVSFKASSRQHYV